MTLALYAPAFAAPFTSEELRQFSVLEGDSPSAMSWWQLWRWRTWAPEENLADIASGWSMWWSTTSGGLLAFFRPLSSVVFVLEHALIGRNAIASHLHSMLWFFGIVGMLSVAFRAAMPARLAGIALAVFAISGVHEHVLEQVCARHILVTSAMGVFAWIAYVRWRERGWRPGLPLALLGLVASACGGEAVLQVMMYGIAYELVGNRGPVRRRALAIASMIVLAGAYAVVHRKLGYGADYENLYLTVSFTNWHWLQSALAKIPWSINALFLGEDWFDFMRQGKLIPTDFVGFVIVVCVAIFVFVWRGRAKLADPAHRTTLAFVTGGALSVLPGLLGLKDTRTLFVPSIGAAVGIAAILDVGWRSASVLLLRPTARMLWRFTWVATALAVASSALNVPRVMHIRTTGMVPGERNARDLHADFREHGVRGGDVFLLEDPSDYQHWYARAIVPRAERGYEVWTLVDSVCDLEMTRTTDDTMAIDMVAPCVDLDEIDKIDHTDGPQPDIRALTKPMVARATKSGRHTEFTFVRSIDDPEIHFFIPVAGHVSRVQKPRIGERVLVRGVASTRTPT